MSSSGSLLEEEMDKRKIEELVLSEINLTHKSLEEGVEYIIEWIRKQPHLPEIKDKELIKSFIVGSKSVERAKEKMDKYFTVRAKYPLYYGDRDPHLIRWPAVEKTVKLPGLTPTGLLVFLIIPPTKEEDLKVFDYDHTIKVFFMVLDRVFRTQPVISGHIMVLDCKNLGLEFVIKCLSAQLPTAYSIYQGAVPVRLANVILFNASSAAEFLAEKLIKKFLNEKLRQRVVVHAEDHRILSKYFPPEMLPSDYGGAAPSVQQLRNELREDLVNNRDWFVKEGSEKCDEAKRPHQDYDADNIQGTFRKIVID